MNLTAKRMWALHTHAEIVNVHNPEQIVYREADVIKLLMSFGIEEPDFTYSENDKEDLDKVVAEMNEGEVVAEIEIPEKVLRRIEESMDKIMKVGRPEVQLLVQLYKTRITLDKAIRELENKMI